METLDGTDNEGLAVFLKPYSPFSFTENDAVLKPISVHADKRIYSCPKPGFPAAQLHKENDSDAIHAHQNSAFFFTQRSQHYSVHTVQKITGVAQRLQQS